MAVGLCDVSIDTLFGVAEERGKNELEFEFIFLWLLVNKITNYQELAQKVDSTKALPVDAYAILKSHLVKTRTALESKVAEGVITSSDIYSFDVYERAGIDIDTAIATDMAVMGSSLIGICFTNNIYGRKKNTLEKTSICEMKRLLSHLITPNFNNGASTLHIQSATISQYAASIDFYDQQVVRLWLETNKRGKNLFNLNFDERRKLVIEQLPDIVDYILSSSSRDSIWGELTPNKISLLRQLGHRVPNPIGINVPVQQEKLINDITGHVTPKELAIGLFKKQEIPFVTESGIEYIEDIPINRFTRSLVRR